MRVIGYTRVSKERGRSGESFISPERQRELVSEWARRNDAELVDVLYEGDQSGARTRPQLTWAVEQIEDPRSGIDGIVVPKLDRFFREQLGGHTMIKRLRDADGFIVVADGAIDSRTQPGRMMLGFLLTIAENEYENYTANFADARMRAVTRGIHPCANTPVGYRREQRGTTPKGNPKLVGKLLVDPETGPLVHEMFERAASGQPWIGIARSCERVGLKTGLGNQHWTARAVKTVVRNRVYKGHAFHGEFINECAHEPLVDDDLWRQAQRPGRLHPPRGSEPALLAGIMRCAGCSHRMTPTRGATGKRRYDCRKRYPGGVCEQPTTITAERGDNDDVHDFVVERFFQAVGEVTATCFDEPGRLEELDAAVGNARFALEMFRDLPAADIVALGREEFAAGLVKRKADLLAAERERDAERDRLRGPLPMPVADLRSMWPDLSVPERRELLALAVDAVFVFPGGRHTPTPERVHVCLRGEAPEGLPNRHTSGRAAVPPRRFRRP